MKTENLIRHARERATTWELCADASSREIVKRIMLRAAREWREMAEKLERGEL